ncbi:MAG: uracil-DNA glycosylase family protein [Neisseria sp.]|uniref:uracil-DNA glycosylase family protein n=1 Tax=Neisseria sp. TaxID=192066 RepID=UPI0026DD2572|nr:uracil-DNA glycosylase family protein [Neisseria sp.]MDO4641933.1 uracil-DNA glycosylase family protein [Neisseria sp.]
MNQDTVETHPLPPFAPPNARLLMLGSFPPPRARWKMDFYYPNFQNDMWRIFGLVFFNDKDYFLTTDAKSFKEKAIRDFLINKGIAISDTAYQVRRLQGNASDKFLQIVAPVNLAELMNRLPACDKIMTTGELATETLLSLMPPNTAKPTIGSYTTAPFCGRDVRLFRMPSSSRAYPLALTKKAAAYKEFFEEIGLLS